jgi:RNA polymerase sigma-70 factor (ECF subfamily)
LADVDDFVQDSFLKTLRAHKEGRLTSTRGFLFHVARNAVVSFFRKQKFISPIPVNDLGLLCVLEGDADVVESVCSKDELELITAAIADLPDRCRQVVMLRVLRGLSSEEAARQLGLSAATVRVQMSRGMKRCSQFLRERGVIAEASA